MLAAQIEIEPMTLADYAPVRALWQQTAGMSELETRDEFQRFLDRNPGLSLVARPCGAGAESVVGAVFCGHDGRRGYLYHLAVAANFRRQGIAEALVQRCLASLAALQIPRCSIHIYANNELGQAFWRRTGWRERTDLKVFATDLRP